MRVLVIALALLPMVLRRRRGGQTAARALQLPRRAVRVRWRRADAVIGASAIGFGTGHRGVVDVDRGRESRRVGEKVR
ncbi:hypothetical protein [Nocardia callitridis]|uniref:hypothetical protein n=1 Tax=Nocardia callitridis TaxID=648753 RepID=UPI0031EF2745